MDIGSDFVLKPREDGQGSDLVTCGVIPRQGDSASSQGLEPAGMVTLTEVHPSSVEKWDQGVKDDIVSFLGTQRSERGRHVADSSG